MRSKGRIRSIPIKPTITPQSLLFLDLALLIRPHMYPIRGQVPAKLRDRNARSTMSRRSSSEANSTENSKKRLGNLFINPFTILILIIAFLPLGGMREHRCRILRFSGTRKFNGLKEGGPWSWTLSCVPKCALSRWAAQRRIDRGLWNGRGVKVGRTGRWRLATPFGRHFEERGDPFGFEHDWPIW